MSPSSAPNHIALVGLPGVGKSTLAISLAAVLGKVAVDLDDEIVAGAGCSVVEIFDREGEAGFRRRESAALVAATDPDHPGAVIACGGGIVLDPVNRRALIDRSRCVWLAATPATLVARVKGEPTRPLLAGDVAGLIEELAVEREPLYREVAAVTVDVTGRSPDDAFEAILGALR